MNMLFFEKKEIHTKQFKYYKTNLVDSKIFINLNEFASLRILKGAFF